MLTLRGLSRKLNMPYSTTRKYLFILKDNGFVRVREGPVGLMIDEESQRALERFIGYIREGLTIEGALRKMKENDGRERNLVERIEKMERDLEEIKESIQEIKNELFRKRRSFLSKIFGGFKRKI